VNAAAPLHVVAGVLREASGRVLLARRRPGTHLAGLWEFPGGKCEPGESPRAALERELHEELGVVVTRARPLIAVPHDDAGKRILLDVWDVAAYGGEPRPCEGQELAWTTTAALRSIPMPAADRPVAVALALPDRCWITPADADLADVVRQAHRVLEAGVRLVRLRRPAAELRERAALARTLRDLCRQYRAAVLLNADWRLAMILGVDGVHLPARTAATLETRPLPEDRWVGVSCHDAGEIAQAVRIGADFVTLSPVLPTPSHPDRAALGWERFARLVADCPLPVHALGGMTPVDLERARECGAHGIAAIRGLLPQDGDRSS
jgi:8-oxo-dGTP diphosphatase